MEVGLAGDDRSGSAQLLHEPGVALGIAIQIAIEVNAATGGRAGKIKTIFYRNRQTPERRAAVAEGASARRRHRLDSSSFGARPLCVLPDVRIVPGVPIAVRERGLGELGWTRRSSGKRSAEIAEGPWGGHKAILRCGHRRGAFSGV